jgi:hypothetical protein
MQSFHAIEFPMLPAAARALWREHARMGQGVGESGRK